MLILNIAGGVIAVFSIFISLVIAGRLADVNPRIAMEHLSYICGTLFIVSDLGVRFFYWWKLVWGHAEADPNIITREGAFVAPRRPFREVLESLFHMHAGGQYFYVLPAWLLGVAIIAAKLAGFPPNVAPHPA